MSSSRRLRALITNDDGIHAPGLAVLAGLARDAGFDVTVAAPHRDSSGVGASVLAVRDGGAVRASRRALPELDGTPAWAVEGHPAFVVHSALRGWLEPAPDVVLSGVNAGANVGRSVIHSGTVGAALAAGLHGLRALAVSLDCGAALPPDPHWDAVAAVLPAVLDILLGSEDGTVLSLNVPDRPVTEMETLREARLVPFGPARLVVQADGDGEEVLLRPSGSMLPVAADSGTDVALLAAGHPTLTRLATVTDRPGVLDPALL